MKHNERECREKYEAYLDVFVLLLGCRYDRKIIASHSRIRPLPLVRMILFHQLKREGFSPTCIGVATEFNHSSIFHGEKMVNDIIAHPNYDPEVFDLYTKFHEAIKDKEDDED